MKYAIKGGLFLGVIQLIFFILSNISLSFFNSPLALLAITLYCICLLPTGFIVRFIGDTIKISFDGNTKTLTDIFNLKSNDWFTIPHSSWIFSTIVLILIGALIGFIYGKIRGRENINN